MSNITIIGGHGKVALRLAKILSAQKHSVISVIRDKAQAADISATGAKPEVLSLEDAPASTFAELFQRTNTSLVYFSAGAGGKGGEARTKAVDYDGALKIFDAIELVPQGSRPFLVLVSGIDIRHPDKIPAHYNDEDKATSKAMREAIPTWVKWKYAADKELNTRTGFKWFVLRPGGLLDGPATGKASVGRTRLKKVEREDVAQALALLADKRRQEAAAGLHLDIVQGEGDLTEEFDAAVARKENAWTE